MPRVVITADDGRVTWDEYVHAGDFESEHFRRCLADRLWWATRDAERPSSTEPVVAGAPDPELELVA